MRELLGRIRMTYVEEVLGGRTRVVQLLGRKCRPQIDHTFLGCELKLGRKRVTCPDLTTARYLKIFAEIGLDRVHVPYDPTRTARVLPDLEQALEELRGAVRSRQGTEGQFQRALGRAFRDLRAQLKQASLSSASLRIRSS